MEIESVNENNNKNKTTPPKTHAKFFNGRTKRILILLSTVLILTCIIAIPLAQRQNQPITLTLTNNVNPNSDISIKETPLMTLGSTSSGSMSLVGNMITIGDTELSGLLNISRFDQIVLGPLTTNGTQNISADKIEINKPGYAGDTITLTGNPSNPTIVNICGNIIIGKEWGTDPSSYEISMNITDFYQYVESHSTGWIGDYLENGEIDDLTNDLPLNTKDAIKVHQGTLFIYSYMYVLGIKVESWVTINSTHFVIDNSLLGTVTVPLAEYENWANVSQMKEDGKLGTIGWFIGDVMDTCSMYWTAPVTFEAKGPWFALGSGGGIITMYDTYTQMISNDTMIYTFLGDSPNEAGFRVNSSTNYPKAVMNITTQEQLVNGQGRTYITNGSTALTGAVIEQENQIVNGVLKFQGDMIQTGNITIQGNIGMGGTSYIKGPVSISGSLNINSGTMMGTGTISVSEGFMQTVGGMDITNGVVKVSGKIVMSPSGTYIGSTTSITGDAIAVNGVVTNEGSVKMTGTFTLLIPLSMNGVMVTNGITSMGSLGTINGLMNVMGNIVMSGVTVISGDNNIMGSMTVTPSGVTIYGMVGLTGVVYTSSMPSIGPTTILELLSGSMMGLPIPHMSILMDPLALVALGILGIGSVYVVSRIVYFGIKERRTLIQLVRIYSVEIGRSISRGVKKLFRKSGGKTSE